MSLLFAHANGNIDAIIYEDDCLAQTIIDFSTSIDDDEHLHVDNFEAVAVDVLMLVYIFPAVSGVCNDYEVLINGLEPGNNYCESTANSTGVKALMSAAGSTSVSTNDLKLKAAPIPASQAGLFFYSQGTTQVAFGDGYLCVAGSSGQLYRIMPPLFAVTGVLELTLDYTSMPFAGRPTPGSTWNFQCCYRDPAAGGAGFNLSDGYSVLFQP